jgi:hypothetical protein
MTRPCDFLPIFGVKWIGINENYGFDIQEEEMKWKITGAVILVLAVILFQFTVSTKVCARNTSAGSPTGKGVVGRTVNEGDVIQPKVSELPTGILYPSGFSDNTARTGIHEEESGAFGKYTFRVSEPTCRIIDGSRAAPVVVDTIHLGGLGLYSWGISYDWDTDALWVTDYYNGIIYRIAKTSPLTILGSVTVSGMSTLYYTGIAYGGSNIMYMVDYWAAGSIYQIDLSTGIASLYRYLPWWDGEGLGWSVADDAAYPGDWTNDQCAYAIPSQTGGWNLWTRTDASGLAASYDATTNPAWLWVVDENLTQAYLYQYSLTAGVPSALPSITWDLPVGMSMDLTADCAYDGQYVYVVDQGTPDVIWILDPVLLNLDAEVVSIDYPNIDCFVMPPAVPVTVQATIRNNGVSTETFDVLCSVDSAGVGNIVYSDIESVTLNSGASTSVSFLPQWNAPIEDVNYYVTVETQLAGDENPANDSLATRAKAVTWTDEIAYDDGVMTNAWHYIDPHYDSIIAKKFEPPYYPCFLKYAAVYLLSETDLYWPWPDAIHEPVELTVWLDTNGDDIPDNLAFSDTVTGDATAPSWVYVVPIDTLVVSNYNFWVGYNELPGGGVGEGVGLDAVTDFPANKYVYNGSWHTQNLFAGDEMIRAYVSMLTLDHNVGVSSIDNPLGSQVPPLYSLAPQATVTNYGLNTETFDVTCEIDQGGAPVYTNTQPVTTLAPGNSTPVTFANWTTGAEGSTYNMKFFTQLVGDQYKGNDTLSKSVYCSYWIFYDDGTSEMNYIVGAFDNDKFAIRFTPLFIPFDCESIAVYLSLLDNLPYGYLGLAYWDYVQVCPDKSGLPDTSNPDTVFYNVGYDDYPQWLYRRTNVTNITSTNDIWVIVHWMDSPDTMYLPCMGSDAASSDGRSWWYANGYGWNQEVTYDWMVGVKLTPPAVTDAQVVCVDNPYAPGFVAGTIFSPVITVKNNGSGQESFDVTFKMDSAGTNVHTSTKNVHNLKAGGQTQVTFDPFTAPAESLHLTYSMKVYAELAGDERAFNDTISRSLDCNMRVMALIKGSDPWTYASIQDILNTHGVPFGVYTRWLVGNVDLSQFSKVVVPSDQYNIFYSTIQSNNAWFESFVNNGGYFELHSADAAWRAGYWNTANPLPGGYYWNQTYVDSAYIHDPRHIILDVPNVITKAELATWNYVTHGYYPTVPATTDTVLMADDGFTTYGPCLTVTEIPTKADTGLFIYTGLTPEWSWAYSYSRILENMLLYPPLEPLAVELNSFTADFKNGEIILRWSTACEEDNLLWRIDRREEGEDWALLTTVLSEGNSPTGHSYEYRDKEVLEHRYYTYRLGDIDTEGKLTWRMTISVYTHDSNAPKVFALRQAYPNPFFGRTTIEYQVPRKTNVEISIYDVSGRLVEKLVHGIHEPGYYEIVWNGRSKHSTNTGIGMYFCRMEAEGFTKTRRLIRF